MTERDTNGKALVEHWTWATQKGLMNSNTASGLRAACTQVLSVLGEEADTVDIKTLDIEDTLNRFQNLKKREFTPGSLGTYKQRFRKAVTSYLDYLNDPGGWKPKSLDRSVAERSEKTSGAAGNGADRQEPVRLIKHEMPQSNMVDYPYPVREGQIARLVLPRDLKTVEVKRLAAFLATLAVDFEAAP